MYMRNASVRRNFSAQIDYENAPLDDIRRSNVGGKLVFAQMIWQ